MTNKKVYDTPKVRIFMMAGIESVLTASPAGSLPDVEEVENEFIY